jgi:hypothetical protein
MNLFTRFEDVPQLPALHQCLLDALLGPDGPAVEAFARWARQVDFDLLDYSSLRLVPALYERYRQHPACEPYRARMKGIYRYFLFRSNIVAADARRAVAALAAGGIEALPFKGVALALRHHGSLALRPMADVDVLIRHADRARAQQILREQGWTYRYSPERMAQDVHSHDYINAARSGFDLHWYALLESPVPGIDEGLWQRAVPGDWQGLPVRWMGCEDLVLTTMVNGLRDRLAMRFEWIVDVARVVRDTPGFDWARVWQEAGARRLRPLVLDAMLMLRHNAPDLLPLECLNRLLAADADLSRTLLERLVAENRTEGLNPRGQRQIARILAPRQPRESVRSLWRRRRQAYARQSADPSSPKYIRCVTEPEGSVTALYLHRQHLHLLPLLFRCNDLLRLRRFVRVHRLTTWRHEGLLRLEPGLLTLPAGDVLPDYRACIRPATQHLVVRAGETTQLALEVVNDSPHFWYVLPGSEALFGVSFHLVTDSGQCAGWEQPRTWLTPPAPETLAFIAPGQTVARDMRIHAPAEPGHYRLQLDVVQEQRLWFSQKGVRFPEVTLEVTP